VGDAKRGTAALTILVTGSAGFIGFHCARRLLAQGEHVVGLDNMNAYYDVALKEARHRILGESNRFETNILDLADGPAVAALLARTRPRVVLHLAAQAGVRHALKAPQDYVTSNIQGSFNLLEACRAAPPEHLLLASTSSVYGATTALPFQETDPADTALNIYSASKRAMEIMGHSHAHIHGLPITAFRFFTVYGPWGRPDMALFKFTDAMLKGVAIDLYNHGDMRRDFTFIDDMVEAILRLAALPPVAGGQGASPVAPYRVVNIGGGAPVRLLDFVAEIEAALNLRARTNLLPMQPGEVPVTWADPSLLRALTGFVPQTPVSFGVPEFVRWFRAFQGR